MEKKSERFEIRLSHTDKQAFQAACDEVGETPSNVIRRFIQRYIRRADADRLREGWHALRAMAGRNVGKLSVAGIIICFGFASVATFLLRDNVAHKPVNGATLQELALFTEYDRDHDGVLRRGEIRSDDAPIFRVLDVDGSGTINLAEFVSRASMVYVDLKPYVTSPGSGFSYFGCEGTYMQNSPHTSVEFDLRNTQLLVVNEVRILGDSIVDGSIRLSDPDRIVAWYPNGQPCVVFDKSDFEARSGAEG
ncbi:hypothetical protein RYZ27_09960 [Hyphomonas sp. FCG-A18]|uniref:hypothetical protein n=1 Tax=Hyphomonas sp. FCG-A18 TaxID=3080019 RepID=UPI002B2C0C49|nr:hypothetical protein RYZ27_09960 [Hyphomonas sp. FCG-A18]